MTVTAIKPQPDEPPQACPCCGSVACCAEMPVLIAELQEKIRAIEGDNSTKATTIRRLKRETDAQLKASPHYPQAVDVLEYWRKTCYPKAVELGGERLRKVLERLKAGYTVEQLKRAVDGYAAFPYVVDGRRMPQGTPARRYIDAELVFRNAQKVDAGLALADEAERRGRPLPSLPAPVTNEDQLGALGLAAVRLAKFGFHVFPIAPMDKIPVTPHGLLDATREIERIVTFWLKYPDHNVGIRCGIESELVVLDVDGDEGYASLRELEDQFEKLPPTASVVTPRGGEHFYFRHPGKGGIRNTTGYPLPALDIRGDGGYVLAPPSVGPTGRRYEVDESVEIADLPGWLLRMLVERQSARTTLGTYYALIVREGAKKGERNSDLLRLAGHLWSHGHEPEEVLELVAAVNEARCRPPVSIKELKKIVQSVARMRARGALRGEHDR